MNARFPGGGFPRLSCPAAVLLWAGAARLLAARLREVPGLEIPHPVESNIVIVEVSGRGLTAADVLPALAAQGVLAGAADHTRVRFVTHIDVTRDQVAAAADAAARVLGGLGAV